MRKSHIAILLTLTAAILAYGSAWLYFRITSPRPIQELGRVFYSPPPLWAEFYQNRMPEETGWVHLPLAYGGPDFKSNVDVARLGFVRAEVCGECHAEKYEGLRNTAHYQTSREASRQTVLGQFGIQGQMPTRDPNLRFEMIDRGDGLYQRVVVQKDGKTYEHSERFDIVTGSGKQGQTSLYWHEDLLLQLPISYFLESEGWINSPGRYRDGTADFARPITIRCLDCHATFFAAAYGQEARYDRSNYILGVTCVRCHGPGWAHVQYHRTHPDETAARYIVHPGKLPRERANDVCAQCHSGVGELLGPAFGYQPGDPLGEHLALTMAGEANSDDPHAANQLARLIQSRCYQGSPEMTCATCHDPHRHERGELKTFAARCGKCHESVHCKVAAKEPGVLMDRCVECHMPSRRDMEGVMQTSQGQQHPLVRDHFIKVWPDAAAQVLQQMPHK